MNTEFYIIVSILMVSIGLGSVLGRKNIFAIIQAIVTCFLGVLILVQALSRVSNTASDSLMFSFCLVLLMLLYVVIGCAIGYRRFFSTNVTSITEKNQLRH